MFGIFASIRIKPDQRERFLATIRDTALRSVREEPDFYKLVRHPLMVGFIIAFWATPDMTTGHALFAAVTTAYILIAIQLEERDLIAMLGEAYTSYRDRAPALVPFTKRGRGARKSSGDAPSAGE